MKYKKRICPNCGSHNIDIDGEVCRCEDCCCEWEYDTNNKVVIMCEGTLEFDAHDDEYNSNPASPFNRDD